MPCDVLSIVEDELMSLSPGCFHDIKFLSVWLELGLPRKRYSPSASCASGDGSETFSQGSSDISNLTMLRGDAAFDSKNASKHEFEQG